MPPVPKPANLLQRRNKSPTRATLPTAESMADAVVPDLPGLGGDWHPMVVDWWRDVWRSPMASEYLKADIHGLYRLAKLQQDFWDSPTVTGRLAAASEIRLASIPFGLSPIDRRRLQWEIEKGDQAEERITRRRSTKKENGGTQDPRDLLKVV